MTNECPRLCGGTFFTLLLQALKQRTKARQRIAGERDGLSATDLLIGLIRIAYPEYKAASNSSFTSNTSDYKKCKISTSSYLPFDWPANIEAFDKEVTADYRTPLQAMSSFVDRFIEVGTSANKEVHLVKALLELIRDDKTMEHQQLYCCESGQPIAIAELVTLSEICLPAFLLGIWHFIFVNRRDNTVGAATFDAWHKAPSAKRAKRDFIGLTGVSITRAIKVRVIGEPEIAELTPSNVDVQSTMRTEKQPDPKSLLDQFEDAIDKYNIAEFVDSDFTAMPLYFDAVVAVDEFVEVLRYTLRTFRRKQDSTYRYVISFINTLEQYQAFLSERMICDNGETIHGLRNIDWSEVHEVTLSLRRELNKLYGLISGGGSLSVFGYTSPDDDEPESGESKDSSKTSTASNFQVVNKSNTVKQQDNIQIGNNNLMVGSIGSLTINND